MEAKGLLEGWRTGGQCPEVSDNINNMGLPERKGHNLSDSKLQINCHRGPTRAHSDFLLSMILCGNVWVLRIVQRSQGTNAAKTQTHDKSKSQSILVTKQMEFCKLCLFKEGSRRECKGGGGRESKKRKKKKKDLPPNHVLKAMCKRKAVY